MSEFGKLLADGLEELVQKLQSGEPVEATEVEIVETEDGPKVISRKVLLNSKQPVKDDPNAEEEQRNERHHDCQGILPDSQ